MQNLTDKWALVLKEIEGEVTAVSFDLWIKNLEPVDSFWRGGIKESESIILHSFSVKKRPHNSLNSSIVNGKDDLPSIEVETFGNCETK